MFEWLSEGALPMGMIFMGVTLLGVLRRKAGNIVARTQYPGLAEKLGLRYLPSEYKKGVGRLEGKYRGFRIIVDPDDQRRIFLGFSGSPQVELHTFFHSRRSAPGQEAFRPSSNLLARLFKTSHASSELIEAFEDASDLPAQLGPLKFVRELKTLSVSARGVTAVFDYGNPPYIPAGIIEDLLPRFVALASVFETPEGAEPRLATFDSEARTSSPAKLAVPVREG